MGRRPLEIQDEIDRGQLWREFKKTAWYGDLTRFLNEKINGSKDVVVELTLAGKASEAHVEAARVAGLREVLDFIEGHILAAEGILDEEKAQKDYAEGIPRHVQ